MWKRGGLINGDNSQGLRGKAAPGHRRAYEKFSKKFLKKFELSGKYFDFLKKKLETFNEKLAVFSKILKNLLECLAKIWRNIDKKLNIWNYKGFGGGALPG